MWAVQGGGGGGVLVRYTEGFEMVILNRLSVKKKVGGGVFMFYVFCQRGGMLTNLVSFLMV